MDTMLRRQSPAESCHASHALIVKIINTTENAWTHRNDSTGESERSPRLEHLQVSSAIGKHKQYMHY